MFLTYISHIIHRNDIKRRRNSLLSNRLVHQIDLSFGQVSNLFTDRVNIGLPIGQKSVQFVPMLSRKGSMHSWGYMNDLEKLKDVF